MPNGIALTFWILPAVFFLFATGLVVVRSFQLQISAKGALVPFGLLIGLYAAGTLLFHSAASNLIDKLKQLLGDDEIPVRT